MTPSRLEQVIEQMEMTHQFRQQVRGGYGYWSHWIPCRVIGHSAKRVRIEFEIDTGKWIVRSIAPQNIRRISGEQP